MKNLALLLSLAAVSLGFSSCCSMFSLSSQAGSYRTETRQVKTCGYDIVTEEIVTPGDAKSGKGGMVQTVEKKVPRYKTVTKRVRVAGGSSCVRYFCPKKDNCGTTSQSMIVMSSAQGPVGSPHIGLIPTMKPIAP
jgi:hypothetical protein